MKTSLMSKLKLLTVMPFICGGIGCTYVGIDCSDPNVANNPDFSGYCTPLRSLQLRNFTTSSLVVFPVLPGDSRNPASDTSQVQGGGVSVNQLSPFAAVVDPFGTGAIDAPDGSGVQVAVASIDENGAVNPQSLAGKEVPPGPQSANVFDTNPNSDQDPLFIQTFGGGGGPNGGGGAAPL